MVFAHPKMFWLMAVALPLLGLFLWWSWRRKQFLTSQFVQSRLLAHLTVGLSRTIQKARLWLLVLAVGFIFVALARPQWGFAWEEAKQRGLDIVVAIDTSRSMLAEDIAPNRLERAKLAALDLVRLAKRDRLGLIAFAGTAFLQCPLTLDDEAFRQSINQLNVGIIPQGGTALAEAIQTASSAFKDEKDNHKVLVMFTDGEDHDSGALEAAERAAHEGLRIFTVGVGTPNGELLRQKDDKGNLNYIKDDQGNVVKSRLNQALLTQIATAANGFYLPMTGSSTVDVLYQRGLAPLPKNESTSKLIRMYHERFQWPLGLAILLLLLEMFLPDRKRVSRNEAIMSATNPELRKIVALLVLGLTTATTLASPGKALRDYEAGHYKDAYQEYLDLLQRRPDDPRLQYNAGAAAYQAKKFEEAQKHFSAAATAPDLKLQEKAYYNLGNSFFRAGEDDPNPEQKKQNWEQSLKQFETALKLDPKDPDAQFNRGYVQKRLEELKQQQQQQQQQSNQEKDKEDKDKDKKDQNDKQDKQDQQQQQQKDQKDQKDSQQDKKDRPKPDQQPEKKPDQNKDQQSSSPENKDKEKEGQSASQSKGNADTNETGNASAAIPGQMTPEQAKQLLDSQKDKEKVMIFLPQDQAKNRKRVFKDW
jgi:Ca-activated chloride channel homolog